MYGGSSCYVGSSFLKIRCQFIFTMTWMCCVTLSPQYPTVAPCLLFPAPGSSFLCFPFSLFPFPFLLVELLYVTVQASSGFCSKPVKSGSCVICVWRCCCLLHFVDWLHLLLRWCIYFVNNAPSVSFFLRHRLEQNINTKTIWILHPYNYMLWLWLLSSTVWLLKGGIFHSSATWLR